MHAAATGATQFAGEGRLEMDLGDFFLGDEIANGLVFIEKSALGAFFPGYLAFFEYEIGVYQRHGNCGGNICRLGRCASRHSARFSRVETA